MKKYSGESHLKIGAGADIAVGDLAVLIGEVVGYTAGFAFDEAKPDGTPRKLLDGRRLSGLGWRPRIGLRGGLRQTYAWFLENATSEMDNGYAGSASFQ